MSYEPLTNGDQLSKIVWPDNSFYAVGKNGLRSIEIVMIGGQMGCVPWAVCEYNEGRQVWVNLANVDLVER